MLRMIYHILWQPPLLVILVPVICKWGLGAVIICGFWGVEVVVFVVFYLLSFSTPPSGSASTITLKKSFYKSSDAFVVFALRWQQVALWVRVQDNWLRRLYISNDCRRSCPLLLLFLVVVVIFVFCHFSAFPPVSESGITLPRAS